MCKPLRIGHLYPELLNLYADKGNIQVLVHRCQWRGLTTEVTPVYGTDTYHLQNFDLVLLGGGSDREQELVAQTLYPRRQEWQSAISDGLPLLAICGGYQLLGEFYQLADGHKVPGLGILDMQTVVSQPRLIGNIGIDSPWAGRIVGFENHGGRTTHHHNPLGQVLHGHGNNGIDGQEGVHFQNVIGTYIHGPLLPKNPQLADFILQTALDYAGGNLILPPLPDNLEKAAQQAFMERRLR
ncbi:glutamine amidotransferase [Alicyclobacillaceae bacterium I2511]|nr:glutamine amidotransferase [Alicyclobacillaceae bacterium I2511]